MRAQWICILLINFILAFLVTPTKAAFSIFPEYHSLTESDSANLESPRQLDSEYQSHLLTYAVDPRWHAAFLASTRSFDWTIGSISGNEFFMRTRGKFYVDLSEKMQFRWIVFQERDYENDQVHQIVELNYAVLPEWRLGAYGEPSFYKRENDVGVFAHYAPDSHNEVRVFRTFTDLVRNERNSRDDRFEVSPTSTGITWRKSTSGLAFLKSPFLTDFVDMTFRYDSFTRWRFPTSKYDYIYEKLFLQSRIRRFVTTHEALNISLQYDNKREGFESLPGRTEPTETWRTRNAGLLASYEYYWSEHHSLRPGLGVFSREWSTEFGQSVSHFNLVPHIWWQIEHWQLGLDSTLFRASGSQRLRSEDSKDTAVEARANIRYDFRFNINSSTAVLSLMATFDLDSFQNQGFEGGNGQFRIDF